MKHAEGTSAVVDALRLGLEPERVYRFTSQLTLHPETLTIRSGASQEAPLLICLHPPRLTEFQFAQRMRELMELDVHLAFPRGLHAHEVDLGGACSVGYAWCHYTGDNPSFRQSLSMASVHLEGIVNRLLEDLQVDRRSIYLLGSEGSSLFATIYAVAHSETFAGTVSLGGNLLPEVLADFLPEKRRIPFLCIHTRRGRHRITERDRKHVDDLRSMGFPVDFETLGSDGPPWENEAALIMSWLSQKAGIPLVQSD
ncbi:MAG: hypothetical protein KAY24_09900 [Candidatus Eisenbacteria sp.]|nr:hypothetical protein [Candidatus Eisenbacteria bacterium]